MLYLAEVQKKSGVFGGGKAELKLLACQRGEQSWSAVPGEDVIQADEASQFENKALVLVELNANKLIQRPPQEAARQLVSILQNFSRLQDKFKTQEEEIEQWKQSLTYQSQELNRREMELQAREEELGQIQEEFDRLEAQRQEIETAREEANRLQEEIERSRQEMEEARSHLNEQVRQLEQQQAELQEAKGARLDEEHSRQIQELLDYLAGAIPPSEEVREQLNQAFESMSAQQSLLDQNWQKLEQQRTSAQQLQDEVDRLNRQWQERSQEWEEAHASLETARYQLKEQQTALKYKQEYSESLTQKLQSHEELHQQVYQLAETSDRVSISEKIDVDSLERMPVDELQGLVQQLEQDLVKMKSFVNDQEEELTMKQETIDELQQKLNTAADYDRRSIETELAEEQDAYQMLNETLEGQRRTLREREGILTQHQGVLWRRLGKPMNASQEGKLDFAPILSQIEQGRQQFAEELQRLEREIDQMRQSIEQAQELVNQQAGEQETKHNELKQLEQHLQEQRVAVAGLWGRVNLYQELLQPVQDRLNELRHKIEEAGTVLSQVQETTNYQMQAISQMREVLSGLMEAQPAGAA